jgi:hypothetical protein
MYVSLETTVGHWEVVPAVLGCYGSLAGGVEAVCRFLDGETDEGPGKVCQAGGRSIALRPFAGGVVSLSVVGDGTLVQIDFGRDSLYQYARVASALPGRVGRQSVVRLHAGHLSS